jgi:hypothetical protein
MTRAVPITGNAAIKPGNMLEGLMRAMLTASKIQPEMETANESLCGNVRKRLIAKATRPPKPNSHIREKVEK